MSTTALPMPTVQPSDSVGEIVAQNPATARIFERFGIDYCCQGATSLQLACGIKGVPTADVLEALNAEPVPAGAIDWSKWTLAELTGYIVSTYHMPLRIEIPRIRGLFEKVLNAHSGRDQRLARAAAAFMTLSAELLPHMDKEEAILFPWIRALEAGQSFGPASSAVAQPIACMERDHEEAGECLMELRRLTDGFTPPDYACATWRALLGSLYEFEQEMHRHVHLENSVLHRRALVLAGGEDGKQAAKTGCGSECGGNGKEQQ